MMYKKIYATAIMLLSFLYGNAANDSTIITVYFNFNHHDITDKAAKQLDSVKLIDSIYNISSIKITAHTDQIGTNNFNLLLSEKRAISAKQYLLTIGINESKIESLNAKGETELLSNSLLEKDKFINRRVVLIIYFSRKIRPTIRTVVEKKETTNTDSVSLTQKIKDTSIKNGDKITLRNINFEGGRHVFLATSKKALNELYEAMKNIPSLVINIEGHICCNEDGKDGWDLDTQTQDLSVRRAKAVYEFLIEKGIDASRMTYEGFGRQFPLTDEYSEYQKMLNRRVEIKIVSK